jgi:putative endonuclease
MAEHNDLGKKGEEMAIAHLRSKGYTILEQNWIFRKEEIDIIATKDNSLMIVEVKTRTSAYLEMPQAAVTKAKQRSMIKAASAYIEKHNIDMETRFDVISVVCNSKWERVDHIEDAFYPGG